MVGAATSLTLERIVMCVFYLLNPMFTFYLTNYLIVVKYINDLIPDSDPVVIPLVGGLHASFELSMVCFAIQFLLYMSLTMYFDYRKSEVFRVADNNRVYRTQPQMQVFQDVIMHETEMTQVGVNWPIAAR